MMNSNRRNTAVLLIAFAFPLAGFGQDEDAGGRLESDIQKARSEIVQAKKDAQKAEAELQKTDSLLKEENARAVQTEDRQAKDRERREKENAALQVRLQETQAKINAERSGLGRWQNSEDEIKARQKRLAMVLAGYCDSVAARIEAGPPWEREPRVDRVKSLKKDLEAGSATIEEGFARLNAVIKEEIKGGDEIALLNKPITRKNGDVVNAQVLKIGNQWLVYMDEEGKRFGILEKKPGSDGAPAWDWREDPGFAEKNRIKAALEVKSAKRPPQLVVLDLGLAANAAPQGSAAKGGK
ncbi:MAG: hypothetical protein JWO30_1373 [Fibrobacteres bacterium]|nr:hypothetical protein [Fibrobacterota bacterium]